MCFIFIFICSNDFRNKCSFAVMTFGERNMLFQLKRKLMKTKPALKVLKVLTVFLTSNIYRLLQPYIKTQVNMQVDGQDAAENKRKLISLYGKSTIQEVCLHLGERQGVFRVACDHAQEFIEQLKTTMTTLLFDKQDLRCRQVGYFKIIVCINEVIKANVRKTSLN